VSARVDTFLKLAVEQGGSDLHLVCGLQPRIRVNGALQPVRFRELTREDLQLILGEIMTPEQGQELAARASIDLAYDAGELGRFRCNVYRHVGGLGAVLRAIPTRIPELAELGLPDSIRMAVAQPKGLVLVTGPTGSGKTTTLAAMVDQINATRRGHIITIEDPIEYVHGFKKSVVTQRQVGIHAPGFAEALRDALREDPDIILVGEMRDAETIALALTAAETGVQVLATLHTGGAARTIDRIVNAFPSQRQDQVRVMLADSLRMIVSQRLARARDGGRRIAVAEVLINTHAVAAMIRAGSSHKLESAIQTGLSVGMQSLDASLRALVRDGMIDAEEAYSCAIVKGQFESLLAARRGMGGEDRLSA
jgi:twitching motility protein PilT